jgi:hypothetical protein
MTKINMHARINTGERESMQDGQDPKNAIASLPQRVDGDVFRAEFVKACQRIEGRRQLKRQHEKLAAWLADFAQCDLDLLSYGEWSNLLYEVSCLSQMQWVNLSPWGQFTWLAKDWEGRPVAYDAKEKYSNWADRVRGNDYAWMFDTSEHRLTYEGTAREELSNRLIPLHPMLPARETVRELQSEILKLLNDVRASPATKRLVPFEIPALRGQFAPLPHEDDTIVFGFAADPQTLFKCNVAVTVLSTAHRIRRCLANDKLCSARWFYAGRSNQYFCSPKCQSRAGTRRNPPKPKFRQKKMVKQQPQGRRQMQSGGRLSGGSDKHQNSAAGKPSAHVKRQPRR